MRFSAFILFLLISSTSLSFAYEDQTLEDDDFAEFEQFEVEDDVSTGKSLEVSVSVNLH